MKIRAMLVGSALIVSSIAMGWNASGLQGRLCILEEGNLHCFDTESWQPVSADFLPEVKFRKDLFSSDNAQCATTEQGVLCWEWKEERFKLYPEFAATDWIDMSDTHLCGPLRDGKRGCVLNAFHPNPPLISLPLNGFAKESSVAVGDGFVCQIYQVGTGLDRYHRLECFMGGGELEGAAPEVITTSKQLPPTHPIRARKNHLCYVVGGEGRSAPFWLECRKIRIEEPNKERVRPATFHYVPEVALLSLSSILPIPAQNRAVALGTHHPNPEKLPQTRVQCLYETTNDPSVTMKIVQPMEGGATEIHWLVPTSDVTFEIWSNTRTKELLKRVPTQTPLAFNFFHPTNFAKALDRVIAATPKSLSEYNELRNFRDQLRKGKKDPTALKNFLLSMEVTLRSVKTDYFENQVIPALEKARQRDTTEEHWKD